MMVRILLAFGLFAVVGAVSFLFARQFFDEATPSAAENPPPVSVEDADARVADHKTVSEAATETPPPASFEDVETRVAELNAISQAEAEKPRFTGELGDFIVLAGDVLPANYPCDFVREVQVPPDSDLFYTLPGGEDSLYGPLCDDGMVPSAFGGRKDGFSVDRTYFVGAKPEVWMQVPRERIELTSVDGHSAILAVRFPELEPVFSYPSIYVVERFPSDTEPGILLRVTGNGTVDDMLSVVRQVISQ